MKARLDDRLEINCAQVVGRAKDNRYLGRARAAVWRRDVLHEKLDEKAG